MINMPNYNKYQIIIAPLLSIESSPMSTSMAVIEIDAQMYLSCICQIYLPYICQIYLSRGAKRGWSICFVPSTLLCCCFPSLHWRGTMAARLFQTVGCKWGLETFPNISRRLLGWTTSSSVEKMDTSKTVKEKSKFIVRVILKNALEQIGVIHVMTKYSKLCKLQYYKTRSGGPSGRHWLCPLRLCTFFWKLCIFLQNI